MTVSVGDERSMEFPALTRTMFVRYAGASGDFNPMHHDDTIATQVGNPSVFGHGMLTMGLAGRVLKDWFGPEGIRANAIAPGVIAHGRFHEVLPEEVKEQLRQTSLVRRFGTPEDIAAMGALLMADEGAFITGQVISVDGGGLMRP